MSQPAGRSLSLWALSSWAWMPPPVLEALGQLPFPLGQTLPKGQSVGKSQAVSPTLAHGQAQPGPQRA